MGSRTWIKIYCDRWLNGTIREETPEIRGIWVDLLVLAGSGKYGDSGEIKITDHVGFLDEQLADLLQISRQKWATIKKKLIETDRVIVKESNIILIKNWTKYQSEFERQKVQRKESPEARMNYSMGVAIANSLKQGKDGKPWELVVGYTRTDLVKHLEARFEAGMNWDNYGEWHVDHIIPKSHFYFQTVDDPEFKHCWALENLQPLWAFDNLTKGAGDGAVEGASRERDKRIEKENRERVSLTKEDVFEVYKKEIMGCPDESVSIPEDIENDIELTIKRFTAPWVHDAILEGVKRKRKDWRYIVGILKNWERFGKDADTPKGDPNKYIRGKYGYRVQR